MMAKLEVWETVEVTSWMVCLCKDCLSDINYALLLYFKALYTSGYPIVNAVISMHVNIVTLARV